MGKRKLFCEVNPLFYKISVTKEIIRRNIINAVSGERFAKQYGTSYVLPNIVKGHTSPLIRKLHGVDIALQNNKAENTSCDIA